MAQTKKQVAKKDNTELATTVGFDMGGYGGAGMEEADKDSFAIPFLVVLQKMSPQVDEAESKYVVGAKPGMLMNSVTEELYDGKSNALVFQPVHYQRRFIHWGNKDAGGGFKGEFTPEEANELIKSGKVVSDEGRLYFVDENGNHDSDDSDLLSDTRNHFGILTNEETGEQETVLISCASSQIKKSKVLMSMLDKAKIDGPNGKMTPPTWANRIRINVVPEKNDKGSWSGIKFTADTEQRFINSQEEFDAGKDFYEQLKKGAAKADYASAADNATEKPEGDKF